MWIVRYARQADLAQMLAIEAVSHNDPWSLADFGEELAGQAACCHSWVAAPVSTPSCVAGYMCFRWLVDEVYIINLAVAPCFRRRGAGMKLMNLCIRWAKAHMGTRLVLDVNRNNLSATAFYRKSGFGAAREIAGGGLTDPLHKQFVMTLEIGD